MWDCKLLSKPGPAQVRSTPLAAAVALLAVFVAAFAGCTSRTLIVVDPCPDGSIANCLGADGSPLVDATDAAKTLRQGLVGLWHFDDLTGSPRAVDSSGNANHAMLVGLDPSTAWVAGRLGTALETRGQGYGLVPLSATIAGIVSEVTVSAWVYFALDGTIVDYGTALSRQIGSTVQQHYHLGLGQTTAQPSLFITTLGNAPIHANAPAAIPRAVWTHLAGTYNGTTAALYVDGALVASLPLTGNFSTDTTPVILGGNGNNQIIDERFPGRIDEIALYNRVLDSNEIQQLANGVAF
jgi:hypothetical protein